MKTTMLAAAILAAAPVGACTFVPDGAESPLADQLASRATLAVGVDSGLTVDAVARGGQRLALDPRITGGRIVLRTTADHYLVVEDLEVPLADVTVAAGVLGPAPTRFTELSLRLGTQLAVALPDDPDDPEDLDDLLVGGGRADLVLDWSMVDDRGVVLPLAIRRLPRAHFTVVVARDPDARLHAAISTRIDGAALNLADLVTLRDLALDVLGEGTGSGVESP